MTPSTSSPNARARASTQPACLAAWAASSRAVSANRGSVGKVTFSSKPRLAPSSEDTGGSVMRVSSKNDSRPHLYRQPAEQSLRPALICLDLGAQCIDVIEPPFVAQPQDEAKADRTAV